MDVSNSSEAFPEDEGSEPVLMHAAVAEAFRVLSASGMAWMLLRGENDLLRPSGELSILVDAEHPPLLDELMSRIGFRRVRAAGHGSHRFYFTYLGQTWVKLDIVSDISFGPFQQWRTTLAPGCLSRRKQIGILWLPASADQAWLQLLHLFLDKGKMSPEQFETAAVAGAIASADDEIAEFVDSHMGWGTADALLDLVAAERWDDLPVFAARMARAYTAAQPLRSRLRGLSNRILRLSGVRVEGPVVVREVRR
jgi:hypothetical protein